VEASGRCGRNSLMKRLGKVFELKNFQSFRCLPDLHFPKSISQVVWKPEVFPYFNSRFDPDTQVFGSPVGLCHTLHI
jgi:hypothetical protein